MNPAATLSPDIMLRLRAETRPSHDATEALPFGTAMLANQLPQTAYIAQLQSYVQVHDVLESELRAQEHPTIKTVWSEDRAKLNLLQQDLEDLDVTTCSLSEPTRCATESMIEFIREIADTDPLCLLGVLYVLEGSTLGGQILRTHVSDMYELVNDRGAAYYTAYGDQTGRYWKQFRSQMNELIIDPDEKDRVVEAAISTFNHIKNILSTLHN